MSDMIDVLIDEEDKNKYFESFEKVFNKSNKEESVVFRIQVKKRRKVINQK